MTIIEEKIVRFQKENEEVQETIVSGSDKHLDLILQIKGVLGPLSVKFAGLMNEIIPATNNFSDNEINRLLPTLLELYSSAIKLVAVLKRCPLARDISATTQHYYSEVENLRELIYDLEHFRTGNEDELDGILNDLNS